MRTSVFFTVLIAGVIAAPIVDFTLTNESGLASLTNLTSDLEVAVEPVPKPDSVLSNVEKSPELTVPTTVVDHAEISDLTSLKDAVEPLTALKSLSSNVERADINLAGLTDLTDVNLLGEVNILFNGILTLVDTLETDLDDLASAADDIEAAKITSEVDDLVNKVIISIQQIIADAGLGLSLTELNPILASLARQIGSIIILVDDVTESGTLGEGVSSLKGLLDEISRLLARII